MPTPDDDLFRKLRQAREQRAAQRPEPTAAPPVLEPTGADADADVFRRAVESDAPSAAGAQVRELVGTALAPPIGIVKSLVTDRPAVTRENPAVEEAASVLLRRQGGTADTDAFGALGTQLRGNQPEGMSALQAFTQQRGFNLPVLQRGDGTRGVDAQRYMRELYASHYAKQDPAIPAPQRRARAEQLAREDYVGAMAVGGRSLPWVTVDNDRAKALIMSLPEPWRPLAATMIPATDVSQTGTTTTSQLRSSRPLDWFGRLGGFTTTLVAPLVTRGELPIPEVRPVQAALTGGADIGLSVLRQSSDEASVDALMRGADIIDAQPVIARAIQAQGGGDWSNALAWAATVGLVLAEPDPISLGTAGVGKVGRAAAAGSALAGAGRGAVVADRLSQVADTAADLVRQGKFAEVGRAVERQAGMLVRNVVEHAVATELRQNPDVVRAAGEIEEDVRRAEELLPKRQAALAQAEERIRQATTEATAVDREIGTLEQLQDTLGGPVEAGTRAQRAYTAMEARAQKAQQDLETVIGEASGAQREAVVAARARLDTAEQTLTALRESGVKKGLKAAEQSVERARTALANAQARPRPEIERAIARRNAAATALSQLASAAQREDIANELKRLRPVADRLRQAMSPAEKEAAAVANTQARIAARERLAQVTERALRKAATSFRAYDQVRETAQAFARPEIGRAMTPLADGARVDGGLLRAALSKVYTPQVVGRFVGRDTPAAKVLTRAMGGSDFKGTELPDLYDAVESLGRFAEMERKGPAAAAFAVFDELDRNPAAQVVSPRDWLATGQWAINTAKRWLAPDAAIMMSDDLVQVLRAHDETMAVMQRDLRDLKQASKDDADWLRMLLEYVDDPTPLPHVRGVTRANTGDDAPFTMFKRWLVGQLELDEKAASKTINTLARAWIRTGTAATADEVVGALQARVRKIVADPTVDTAGAFAARLREATLTPIRLEDGSVTRVAVDVDIKSVPRIIVVIMNGAAGDRAFRAATRSLVGGLTPTEARDAMATLSRNWSRVEDAERAWKVLSGAGLPSMIRRVVDDTGREFNYQLVQVGKEANGVVPIVPRALVDQLDQAADKFAKEIEPYSSRMPSVLNFRQWIVWLKESMTSGLILPGFGNFTANALGDATQIMLTEGVGMALRTSPHASLAIVPYVGRPIQDALSRMAARLKGPVLPALVEAVVDPHIGRVLAGEPGQLVTKTGEVVPYTMLRRELIDRDVYSTFIKEELAVWRQFMPGLRGVLGRHQENLNEFASHMSARQRVLLYLRLREDGVPPVEAQRRTLAALYDWKRGVGAFEARWVASMFMFYRFFKASTIQAGNALLEPVIRPDDVLKTLGYGQTQRARAQINLARLAPVWVHDMMTEDEQRTYRDEWNATAAFVLPTWMKSPAGSWVASPTARAYYQSTEGRVAPFEGWTSLQPTAVASVGFLLSLAGLIAGSGAAALSDDFVMPDDAFEAFGKDLWGMLGPQADVADMWFAAQSDDRGMIPINPGDEAVLGLAASMGAFQFGKTEDGRTTAPANLVRFYRGLVPLLGTQVSPMLTQAFRAFGTQDTFLEGLAATGAAWTRALRRYPANPQRELEYQQRAQAAALRSVSEQREQEARGR